MRGRTIGTFGQAFNPLVLSDGNSGSVPLSPTPQSAGSEFVQFNWRTVPKWWEFTDERRMREEEEILILVD